jgi:hypothetical protein
MKLILIAIAVQQALAVNNGMVTEHTWGPDEGVACPGMTKGLNQIAITQSQYDGGSHCGKCVRIMGASGSVVAQIADMCVGCVDVGSVFDLPPGLFKQVTGVSYDFKPVTYEWVDCKDLGSTSGPTGNISEDRRETRVPASDNTDDESKVANPHSQNVQLQSLDEDKEDAPCTLPSSLGEECQTHDDCEGDLYCKNQVCSKLGKLDDKCDEHSDCKGELYCYKGSCAKLGKEGDKCEVNENCEGALYCKNGSCALPADKCRRRRR